jgi:hypothetical protein
MQAKSVTRTAPTFAYDDRHGQTFRLGSPGHRCCHSACVYSTNTAHQPIDPTDLPSLQLVRPAGIEEIHASR